MKKTKARPTAPDDTKLAWALAETAQPYLTTSQRNDVYISIGIGESFEAIDGLLTAIAREQLRLDAELLGTVTTWLDCYIGQDAEPRLREVIAEVAAFSAQTAPAVDTRHYTSPESQSDSA